MLLSEAQARVARMADRLRELGYDIPPAPESVEFEEKPCECEKKGCENCGGSGILIRSPLVEWNKKISAVLRELNQRG